MAISSLTASRESALTSPHGLAPYLFVHFLCRVWSFPLAHLILCCSQNCPGTLLLNILCKIPRKEMHRFFFFTHIIYSEIHTQVTYGKEWSLLLSESIDWEFWHRMLWSNYQHEASKLSHATSMQAYTCKSRVNTHIETMAPCWCRANCSKWHAQSVCFWNQAYWKKKGQIM